MAREPVAIDFVGLSRGSSHNNLSSQLVRPVADVPGADVRKLAAGVQALSTEGFRNWVNRRVDTTTTSTPDLFRSKHHDMAEPGSLRSKENHGDDSQVTQESLPQCSVEDGAEKHGQCVRRSTLRQGSSYNASGWSREDMDFVYRHWRPCCDEATCITISISFPTTDNQTRMCLKHEVAKTNYNKS